MKTLLESIYRVLNKGEQRYFSLFISKGYHLSNSKAQKLIESVKNGKYNYLNQLKKENKASYYRIRNYLVNQLTKSLHVQYVDKDKYTACLHYISAGNIFSQKGAYQVAFHFFTKAEEIAKEIKNYLLLTHIYDAIIHIAPETDFINPEEYIEKRKKTEQILKKAREIEDLITLTRYRIKRTQFFETQREENFLSTLLKDYFKDEEFQASPELKRELIEAGMLAFLEKRDYEGLRIFLSQQTQQPEFPSHLEAAPEWGIRILTTYANTLFKQKHYKQSLEVANQIQELLPHVKNPARYQFFYYNLLVVNYSVLDIEKAIHYANQILSEPLLKKESHYRLFAYLNLSLLYYKKQQIRRAIQYMHQAITEPTFESMAPRFRLKVWLAFILLWIQRHEYSIAQDYLAIIEKESLNKHFSQNDELMWKIIKTILQNEKVPVELAQSVQDDEDQILSYEQWLKNQGYLR